MTRPIITRSITTEMTLQSTIKASYLIIKDHRAHMLPKPDTLTQKNIITGLSACIPHKATISTPKDRVKDLNCCMLKANTPTP